FDLIRTIDQFRVRLRPGKAAWVNDLATTRLTVVEDVPRNVPKRVLNQALKPHLRNISASHPKTNAVLSLSVLGLPVRSFPLPESALSPLGSRERLGNGCRGAPDHPKLRPAAPKLREPDREKDP